MFPQANRQTAGLFSKQGNSGIPKAAPSSGAAFLGSLKVALFAFTGRPPGRLMVMAKFFQLIAREFSEE